MSLLEFGPKGFFNARHYNIGQNGVPVGEIDCATMRGEATITVGGARYTASRESIMGSAFHLEANGKRLAAAERSSAFRGRFTVQVGARTYSLGVASLFGRAFVLSENGVEIGSIARQGFFNRKSKAELPDELPLEVKAFLIWLVIVMWQRQMLAATMATGST